MLRRDRSPKSSGNASSATASPLFTARKEGRKDSVCTLKVYFPSRISAFQSMKKVLGINRDAVFCDIEKLECVIVTLPWGTKVKAAMVIVKESLSRRNRLEKLLQGHKWSEFALTCKVTGTKSSGSKLNKKSVSIIFEPDETLSDVAKRKANAISEGKRKYGRGKILRSNLVLKHQLAFQSAGADLKVLTKKYQVIKRTRYGRKEPRILRLTGKGVENLKVKNSQTSVLATLVRGTEEVRRAQDLSQWIPGECTAIYRYSELLYVALEDSRTVTINSWAESHTYVTESAIDIAETINTRMERQRELMHEKIVQSFSRDRVSRLEAKVLAHMRRNGDKAKKLNLPSGDIKKKWLEILRKERKERKEKKKSETVKLNRRFSAPVCGAEMKPKNFNASSRRPATPVISSSKKGKGENYGVEISETSIEEKETKNKRRPPPPPPAMPPPHPKLPTINLPPPPLYPKPNQAHTLPPPPSYPKPVNLCNLPPRPTDPKPACPKNLPQPPPPPPPPPLPPRYSISDTCNPPTYLKPLHPSTLPYLAESNIPPPPSIRPPTPPLPEIVSFRISDELQKITGDAFTFDQNSNNYVEHVSMITLPSPVRPAPVSEHSISKNFSFSLDIMSSPPPARRAPIHTPKKANISRINHSTIPARPPPPPPRNSCPIRSAPTPPDFKKSKSEDVAYKKRDIKRDIIDTPTESTSASSLASSSTSMMSPKALAFKRRGHRKKVVKTITELTGTSREVSLRLRLQALLTDESEVEGRSRKRFLEQTIQLLLKKKPETICGAIRQFLNSLNAHIFKKRKVFVDNSFIEEEKFREILESCLQSVVISPIYRKLTNTLSRLTEREDSIFRINAAKMQFKSQEWFGIASHLQSSTNWLHAIYALSTIEKTAVPMEKLAIILSCSRAIYRNFRHSQKMVQVIVKDQKRLENRSKEEDHSADSSEMMHLVADDFFPIFTYVVANADLKTPHMTKDIMWGMCSKEQLQGEGGYYLTVFEAAISFVILGGKRDMGDDR